jgi:hypothetical protein
VAVQAVCDALLHLAVHLMVLHFSHACSSFLYRIRATLTVADFHHQMDKHQAKAHLAVKVSTLCAFCRGIQARNEVTPLRN